ncbi:MAG: DUF3150 domain-containing protein [Chromatiaceae bacterium]|nr:DUF3150 domain-containing protein [Chromatiaceae bacterium]MCF7993227.1 DUF3150 domain-containing protein [Chromatiaceae bacterium]MCF8004507.1 DUF3150 domain-containing protein [Chromatiaceae bacterium]MCF8017728.1 DUF3150 domain-containing protein [Chromatiaceae bacterium]
MVTTTDITDRITLVVLDIRIWSGRKKLRAEDLHLADGAIPPEELVSLGSKRVCDPEPLKPFHRLKQSAERACLRIGTRFLGGFAVPKELAPGLALELDRLKAQFEAETQTFLAGYDRDLERWISSIPAFEAAIRRAVEPVAVVAGRLRFGHQLVEIKPSPQPGTLAEEIQGLVDGVFAEVEQMARELTTSFEGKDKLHRRALGTFTRVRDKLACLSFIDPRIQPVVDSLDDWVRRLPMAAPIEGALFNEGLGLALLLSDAERMARHGAGQLAGFEMPEPEAEVASEPAAFIPEPSPVEDLTSEFAALFDEDSPSPVAPSTEDEAPCPEYPAPRSTPEALSFFF